MSKELNKISVQTLPNGYGLEVNGEKYMYFNEVDLLAGFMAHVGLQDNKYMERGTILSCLFSAMMGDAYANAVTTLKQRVGLLTSKYEGTLEQMDRSIEYANQAEKTIAGLTTEVERLREQVKALSSEQKTSKESVDQANRVVTSLLKKSDEVMTSLANSATIMKAIEDTKKVGKGDKSKKGEKKGEEPAETPAADEGTATGKKGKGGRKKNDEAVLRQIEEQAKNNHDIK